jgi:transposase
MARVGAPRRDLPSAFGRWGTDGPARRSRRWAREGVFERPFRVSSGAPGFGCALIGGTIVRAHRHGTGAKGGPATGPSGARGRGGSAAEIVALVDAPGNPARFPLLPGRRHDRLGAAGPLLDGIVAVGALVADQGFGNDRRRREPDARGALAVTPPGADRARRIGCGLAMHRRRHLVGNFFGDPKRFRRIATRYGETDRSFAAVINIAGIVLAVK